MSSRAKSVIKGALIATVLCGCLPIWEVWGFNSWEASQSWSFLLVANLGFVTAIQEVGFWSAVFDFYSTDLILLVLVCCIGGGIGFFVPANHKEKEDQE